MSVVFSAVLLLVLSAPSQAQEAFKHLSASVSDSLVSGVNKEHKNIYNDFSLSGSYAWNKEVISSLAFGFVKAFTQERKTFLKDLVMNLGHGNLYTHAPSDIILSGYGRLFVPLSKTSRNESQILAIKTGLGLSKNIQSLLLGYEISGSYFIHRYTTAKNGVSNKHYGMTNTLTAGYQFTEQLALNTFWSLLNFATYYETPKATYSFIQEIDYAISHQWHVSAGLSTGGRQYKNNAEELNLSLFDVEGTEVFGGIHILF